MMTRPETASEPIRYDRFKNGHTISVTIRTDGSRMILEMSADRDAPGQVFTCTVDQWYALRAAVEVYFDQL